MSVVNSQNIIISGNTFVPGNGSHNEAINIDSSSSIVIQGNSIRNSFDSGIVLDTDSYGSTSFCTISGNTVELSQFEGIALVKSKGTEAQSVTNIVISGNVIRNNGQKLGENHYGIALTNSSRDTVIGNEIYDDQTTKTQSYGVDESGTSPSMPNNNTIVNNVFWGNKIGPITLVGTNDVVRGNMGYDPVGRIGLPFSTVNPPTVGLLNTNSATPSPNTAYLVVVTDLYIVSTAVNGESITITDSAGNVVVQGLAQISQPIFLAVGYKINFGPFSSMNPPIVVVSAN